ncbi:MAG: 23S rRNA (adenine(2503)-C(2))-methyltransferase RlmN [Patescibacteria group bacterium]
MPDLGVIIASEKKFRQDQIYKAWFDVGIDGYAQITTLPLDLREKLKNLPWLSVELGLLQESKTDNTKKALLKLNDGQTVETVLMGRKSRNTICISSQVGCPMNCAFCATGSCGFTRNLSAQEIVDQYRFWQRYLGAEEGIDNIVVMGQGEPLLNYDNVKTAINIILKYTDIGPRQITISTAGVPAAMEKMIADKDFPPVRFAVSLHSAIDATRKKIMPSHQPGFFDFLIDWSKKYHQAFPSRAHYLGLEYIMLDKVNDDAKHLKAFIKLASKLGSVRINLIPYNLISTGASTGVFTGSAPKVIEHWQETLLNSGFTSTIRHSQGQDIAAACGQLKA